MEMIYLVKFSLIVNMQALSVGAFSGWSSSAFLILETDNTPLASGKLNAGEISWIASSISLGCLTGNFLLQWISNFLGRKKSFLITAVPLITACVMIPWCANSFQLCVSRFLGGLAGGAAFAAIPVYVTEISSDK